ncbi:hypothetical protein CGC20_1670 [Leishmania donovani]|uniref:Uncharacterized protein n=1 Tax=Leishmania donovani TaxID=5661 RepID=A0A504XWH8_LEIDO|nr:hypothetical protein CGC20_1670 [Leishmania donovani]
MIMVLREGVRVSEEFVRRLEDPAQGSCFEAAASRWVEGARARCRKKERVRTWDALPHVWKGMDIAASKASPAAPSAADSPRPDCVDAVLAGAGGLTWAPLSTHPVHILTAGLYYPGWYAMPTLVVVFSTMHGAAFKGRDATQGESRDAAITLNKVLECLLTWALISRGFPVRSARFPDERTTDPVDMICSTASSRRR